VRFRFVSKDGACYGHILDPTTGRPVEGAPRSVTVAAGTCLDACMLATFAMLQGRDAEAFLEAQKVRNWALRHDRIPLKGPFTPMVKPTGVHACGFGFRARGVWTWRLPPGPSVWRSGARRFR